jgi:tripartite-type tricarboxylate transporter receptor subunit TctC
MKSWTFATIRFAFLVLAAGIFQHALAQPFPSKPLRIVVPFPAGATIGADAVARSAPDGYTLLMHNITFPLA